MVILNTALKNARKKANLTQVQVAKKIKTTERNYQYYEAGERVPNVYTAQLIAEALNITVEKIFPLPQENDSTEKL